MAKMEFTDARVRKLNPPSHTPQSDYFERQRRKRSLILTVGRELKTWSVLFYERGKPRRKKLGEFPNMDCNAARKAVGKFDEDKAAADAQAGTFKAVAEEYIRRHVKARKLHSEREIKRLLRVNVYPFWASKRFAEIGRRDVAELLDKIEDERGAGVADNTLAIVRGLMRWFQSRDDNYVCPVVPGMRRQKPKKRQRWLSDQEIVKLWKACQGSDVYRCALLMLLLTGQRRAKILGMRWDDIDLETGEWTIPRVDGQKGAPTAITLPRMALNIVTSMPRIARNPHVFAGLGDGHIWATGKHKLRLDAELKFSEPWRLHDLRRTARKLMTRAGVSTEIAELALGHSIMGIQAVYDDPLEYRPMLDAALLKVEQEVAKILDARRTARVQPQATAMAAE